MEVSSHALGQERTSGIDFDAAVFTNLTRDHLDYHGDLDSYARTKARLFGGLSSGAHAIVNIDDPASAIMAAAAREQGAPVLTFSIGSRADLCATDLRTERDGTSFFLSGMGIARTRVKVPLAGRFNVQNALAAIAAILPSGASPSDVTEGLATVTPAPGRLEDPLRTRGVPPSRTRTTSDRPGPRRQVPGSRPASTRRSGRPG